MTFDDVLQNLTKLAERAIAGVNKSSKVDELAEQLGAYKAAEADSDEGSVSAKQLFQDLVSLVDDATANGNESIAIEKLSALVNTFERIQIDAGQESEPEKDRVKLAEYMHLLKAEHAYDLEEYRINAASTLEEYRQKCIANIEQFKADNQHLLESERATVAFGQYAIRASFLLNGGATVALLAFLGKLSSDFPSKVEIYADCMLYFVIACGLAAIAAAASYITQLFYAYGHTSRRYFIAGLVFHAVSAFLVIASYASFFGGALTTRDAFQHFDDTIETSNDGGKNKINPNSDPSGTVR